MTAHSAAFVWHGKWNLVHLNVKSSESITDVCDRLERMGFFDLNRDTYTGFSKVSNANAFMKERLAELALDPDLYLRDNSPEKFHNKYGG